MWRYLLLLMQWPYFTSTTIGRGSVGASGDRGVRGCGGEWWASGAAVCVESGERVVGEMGGRPSPVLSFLLARILLERCAHLGPQIREHAGPEMSDIEFSCSFLKPYLRMIFLNAR